MNKVELIKEICVKTNYSRSCVSEILVTLLETIQKNVSKGKKVMLTGFGSFDVRNRAARVGRNPQTGKEIEISAKITPVFTAGKRFKELVK